MKIHKRVEPLSVGGVKGLRIVPAVKEKASTRPAISRNVAVARELAFVQDARVAVG